MFRGSRLIVGNLDPIPILRRFRAAGGVLEARVPGTGRDRGPACATCERFRRLETSQR
jgi:hypothetical protein